MAQRGGCVTSHVRYGDKVYSPMARKGDVHILLSFEKIETLRYLDYLNPSSGTIITSEERIYPPAVNLGMMEYPSDMTDKLKSNFRKVIVVDAPGLAMKAGSLRAINTVMLGILSRYLSISGEIWSKTLAESFPAKLLKLNLDAFRLGQEAE